MLRSDSICYMTQDVVETIRAEARAADRLHAQAREKLVAAVRRGAAAGLSQREIADAVGRSQPEVSRLLHFLPRSARGRVLAKQRDTVRAIAMKYGVRNLKVFGSVARGTDGPNSDIDFLADVPDDMSLLALARLERELSTVLGCSVDVVPSGHLRGTVRARARREAVPL